MGIRKVLKRSFIKFEHNLSKKFEVKDKKIIISGSNSGIGLELAKNLAINNKVISLVNKNYDEINKFKNENLSILQQDLEKDEFPESFVNDIKEFKPNIIINCAGTFGPTKQNLIDLDIKNFNKVLNINLFSPLRISQYGYLGDHLHQVINITSEMGSISNNERGGFYYYRLSKTLLNSFSKNLYLELSQKNISVFCICPGSVKTKMNSAGLVPPEICAQKIINIISKNDKNLSGKFININQELIQW